MPHPRMTGTAFDNMMTLASAVILFPVLEHGLKQRCLFSIDTCFDDSMQSGDDANHKNTNTQIQGDFISNNSSLPSDTMMNPATTTELQYLLKDTSGRHQDNSYSCIS